jgi:hypothetical protein
LKENQLCYPTIFALAMDIIPIQGSAVPCECVLSSAKETTTARQNQISGELMEVLQMLKFSLGVRTELHCRDIKAGRTIGHAGCTNEGRVCSRE